MGTPERSQPQITGSMKVVLPQQLPPVKPCEQLSISGGPTAVLQLLYTGSIALKWLFPQQKATFHIVSKGISIGEPL